MTDAATANRFIVGLGPLADFLTSNGFPTPRNTIEKYCSPSVDIGPPVHAYWGKRPVFLEKAALEWAQARMRPAIRRRARKEAASAATAASTN